MASNHAELETQSREKEQASARQGDEVRALKAKFKEGLVTKAEVDAAVELLKNLKIEAAQFQKEFEAATGSGTREAFRQNVLNALERRLFFIPSFKIYGSVAGLYDYGPPGCGIKANVTQAWRQHFVLEEGMLEVECPAVTPEAVLKASGHVDRFVDYMVSDKSTGECHRADHLLEAELERVIADAKTEAGPRRKAHDLLARVGELGAEALGEALVEYAIRSPDTGNELSAPFAFNLMFKTQIGPRGDAAGYLRPETAQGIFVNFRDLLYYAGSKLPFAAAQIGSSYRNEISPRSGLLRVREFTQAEIEHFVNPADKRHPKFARVAQVSPLLYSRDLQLGEDKAAKRLALGEAVARGVIANETLAYFVGRTALFCERIGLDPERVRFRQHLQHEMAHYAEDCWDCEVECSYGWIECAGLADRSAYDLNAHAAAAKVDLTAYETFPEPRDVEELRVVPDKKKLGQLFRKDAAAVMQALEGLCEPTALALRDALARGQEGALKLGDGRSVALPPGSVDIEKLTVRRHGRSFTPGVIEPSFGIGRLLYCLFEHSFYVRGNDAQRAVFRFPPLVAPTKATVFPLVNDAQLNAVAAEVSQALTAAGLTNAMDITANTIGKRYARTDEIGVPFAVTVDRPTLQDGTVTVRDRDSMRQVRVPREEVAQLLRDLADQKLSWADVLSNPKYPAQEAAAEN